MIKRELYLDKIKPYMNKDIIKVLTGVRRCGKSTILKQIVGELKENGVKEENIILINLELQKYFNVKNIRQLDKLIKSKTSKNNDRKYLLLDEIQDVNQWEKLVNSYLAEDKFDIYITGSNAKLLSGELATYITGRYIEIKIYPFSFNEFLEYKQLKNRKINNRELKNYKDIFYEFLRYGAMPSTLRYEREEKIPILTDIYQSILFKDVVKRNEIRDLDLLDRILKYIMANIGQLFSANSIVKYLKKDRISISTTTIYNYLRYLEDARLINKVRREDLIGKRVLNYIEKFYVVDLGFREAIYGNNERDISQAIENIIYNELIQRGFNVTIGKFRDNEIDFVCKKFDKKVYIQVSYILFDENTLKREFGTLSKIKDNYPKYVLSMDEFNRSHDGIKHLNIIDFLKDKIEL
ncbi:MAG: ATP-binding protein [Methanobrevibacter sp.]|jgi:predicted AAA+ superfamily ATPase|nr:ATP-binding protein [Methanobrevibacter sp.]